jgi:hypothetical protein
MASLLCALLTVALSATAMTKLSRTETETFIPTLDDNVRAPERKA